MIKYPYLVTKLNSLNLNLTEKINRIRKKLFKNLFQYFNCVKIDHKDEINEKIKKNICLK